MIKGILSIFAAFSWMKQNKKTLEEKIMCVMGDTKLHQYL